LPESREARPVLNYRKQLASVGPPSSAPAGFSTGSWRAGVHPILDPGQPTYIEDTGDDSIRTTTIFPQVVSRGIRPWRPPVPVKSGSAVHVDSSRIGEPV